jgi:hypothetical protein
MTTITVDAMSFHVTFTTAEKIAGLIRDQHVPLSAVRAVEVVPDGLAATRGIRAPGLGLPGLRMIGTWRGRSRTSLVSVRRDRPAVRITLDGQPYTSMLLAVEEPEAVAAALSRAHR